MAYRLIITERADELLEQLVNHVLLKFKNEQAAKHLLDEIDSVYDRLEDNPYQFSDCRDVFLKSKGYKGAIISDMNYILIFRIEKDVVYVLGIFHQLENYKNKL